MPPIHWTKYLHSPTLLLSLRHRLMYLNVNGRSIVLKDIQCILQVGTPVLIRWSTYGAEQYFAIFNGFRDIRGKLQPVFLHIPVHHFFKARFVDRDYPVFKIFNFFLLMEN